MFLARFVLKLIVGGQMETIGHLSHKFVETRIRLDRFSFVQRTIADLVVLVLVQDSRNHSLCHHTLAFEVDDGGVLQAQIIEFHAV